MKNRTNSSGFRELEAEWYEKIRTKKSKEYPNGFRDIENTDDPDRPLKVYDNRHFQKPVIQKRQIAREAYNKRIDDFINHPEFEKICKSMTRHKNSALTPAKVKKILELHRDGATERSIAEKMDRSKNCVHLTIAKAQEWMKVA